MSRSAPVRTRLRRLMMRSARRTDHRARQIIEARVAVVTAMSAPLSNLEEQPFDHIAGTRAGDHMAPALRAGEHPSLLGLTATGLHGDGLYRRWSISAN